MADCKPKLTIQHKPPSAKHHFLHIAVVLGDRLDNHLRGDSAQLMVLDHLPGQLLKDILGQHGSVVGVIPERYELHQVAFSAFAVFVGHLHVVVVELLHKFEVAVSDTHDNYADGETCALDELVADILHVMDLAVGQDQHNHVLVTLLFQVFGFLHGFEKQRGEYGWAPEFQVFYTVSVSGQYPLHLIDLWFSCLAIQWETMVHCSLCVECRQSDLCPETIEWHQFISIIVQKNLTHWFKRLLISRPITGTNEVQAFWSIGHTITSRKIHTGHQLHFKSCTDKLREVILPILANFAKDDLTVPDLAALFRQVKGIMLSQLSNCEEELPHQIMIAPCTIIKQLALNLSPFVIIAQLAQVHFDSFELRVTALLDDLTLVYKVIFVVLTLHQTEERAVVSEKVEDFHVGQSGCRHLEFDQTDVGFWHDLTSDDELASLFALLVDQPPNNPLLPMSKYLSHRRFSPADEDWLPAIVIDLKLEDLLDFKLVVDNRSLVVVGVEAVHDHFGAEDLSGWLVGVDQSDHEERVRDGNGVKVGQVPAAEEELKLLRVALAHQ